MKRLFTLCIGWLMATTCVYSQVKSNYEYSTSMPYGTLDIRTQISSSDYYYLQENRTFSFRESAPGVRTNKYHDMTSWDSSPYAEGNLRRKTGAIDKFIMNYRLLFPDGYSSTYAPGYPMMVHFHGAVERANCYYDNCYHATPDYNVEENSPPAPTSSTHRLLNNDHNLNVGGKQYLDARNLAGTRKPDDPSMPTRAFPGFVLSAQMFNIWDSLQVEDVIRIVRLVAEQHNIDEDRIYVQGISIGGYAVYESMKRASWLFAAGLPMSAVWDANIFTQNQQGKVAHMPLWIFQGGNDPRPSPAFTENIIDQYRDAGGIVRYTKYPDLSHVVWFSAYGTSDYFSWILKQRKSSLHAFAGNTVIDQSKNQYPRLFFAEGFLAYQWEKDGAILGNETHTLTVTTPGKYRARFSRKSSNPTEAQWNEWSPYVTITQEGTTTPPPVVTVAITNPDAGQVFTAPANISITATASVTVGSIAKVEFYNGATKLAEDNSSPYSFTWTNVPAGNYALAARAHDNAGNTASDGVSISVDEESASCASTGRIQAEVWTGISGTQISSIPLSSAPSTVSYITEFETASNIGDNYGSRVRGYLCVPITGSYTFWIASDDTGELWLSTDEDPATKRRIAYVSGWTNRLEWEKYTTQRSGAISLVAGRRYYVEALLKEAKGGDHLAVGWQLPGGALERPIPGQRLILFEESPNNPPPDGESCASTGTIQLETWTGISGVDVGSIPVDSPPSSVSSLTAFETPKDIGDNYGSRVRGYLCVPVSGNYTFFVASDDRSELWLSTDDNPVNKQRIAYVSGWTYARQWDKYTSQRSSAISLIAGRMYYVEALLKEGSGGDHLAVGWQLPNGALERPIDGNRLIPFGSAPPSDPSPSTGTMDVETWTGITGRNVSSIPLSSSPDGVSEITIFETEKNIGDAYGSRVRGYVHPPATGSYTFWLATDDTGELWLSTDENPANKERIAYVTGWTYARQWDKYTTQRSAAIDLVGGRKYYIEALLKEDAGGDHLAVGWQLPDGALERPIPGSRVSRFEVAAASTAVARMTMSDESKYSQISIYPNPADGRNAQLMVGGYEGIREIIHTRIEIINMTGEIVFTENLRCGGGCDSYLMKINKQLVPGLYLVNMKTNGMRTSKRLLVR